MKRMSWFICALVFCSSSMVMAADPVKPGFLYVYSGRAAIFGNVSEQGARLAIEEINASGGILGRQVVGIFRDTRAKPDVGEAEARKLVVEDKVNAVIGVISSAVVISVSRVMNELRAPFIITNAVNPKVTGTDCNRYTFRTAFEGNQMMNAAALLATKMHVKKWTTIGPDYSLGSNSWRLFKQYLGKLDPTAEFLPDSQAVYAPMNTTDWSEYIRKLKASKADGVLVSLWGGNFVDFVRQAGDAGFFDGNRQGITHTAAMAEFQVLGRDMPPRFWMSNSYLPQAFHNESNRAFVSNYQEKFGALPGYPSHWAYVGVKAYAEAARKAGSIDKERVVDALEGLTMFAPVGKVLIRPGDHQALFDVSGACASNRLEVNKGRQRMTVIRALDPVFLFSAEQSSLPVAVSRCNMQNVPRGVVNE